MIELLTVAIAYVAADAGIQAIVDGRVASKHHYALAGVAGSASAWPALAGLTMTYDPGATPDVDAGMERGRLSCLCYGPSAAVAGQVYAALIALCRATTARRVVSTAYGDALLYYLAPSSAARSDIDPDTHMDIVQVFVDAACHQDALA